ncbi:hypothetical protein GCM10008959_33040 [Deinococcus seoulensis]|uniref:Uncharacterized protein n=1 Tax=Deinococcus seoulensis TaxID=1837379 RepID=A0ABQ2RUG7_9DEIO|nr:hypothetical protein [Deinococcus seoulensis]GGR68327.1 hypothetical protein GCM10008959_33040 [Deinococcus seoulensis]
MIIDGYWLKLMWAVLAGGWFISALIRLILTALSWPDQRGRRLFAVIVHAVAGVFFVWRHATASAIPAFIPIEETYRNLAALLLVTWAILDGIWAVLGMTERRARLIQKGRNA